MQFKKELLSFLIVSMILLSIVMPSYAEVTSLQINKTFFVKGEKIEFSGTVDEDDLGLVTIVIYDSKGEFVVLIQAYISADETFKKTIDTKERFSDHGIHNATAFVVNMTDGKSIRFDFSLDGSKVSPSVSDSQKTNQTILLNKNLPSRKIKVLQLTNPLLSQIKLLPKVLRKRKTNLNLHHLWTQRRILNTILIDTTTSLRTKHGLTVTTLILQFMRQLD